jgi:O-glycosyl hydrolase
MNKRKFALLAIAAPALIFIMNACEMAAVAKEYDAATPVITSQPQTLSIQKTDTAKFTVVAEAKGDELTYQWYQYTIPRDYVDQVGKPLDGEDKAEFTVPAAAISALNDEEMLFYYVVVTNIDKSANGRRKVSVKSAPAVVIIVNPNNAVFPTITKQPVSGESLAYSTRMVIQALEVEAEVYPSEKSDEIRYQWYVTEINDNTEGIPIEGATAPRLIPPVLLKDHADDGTKINGPGNYYYYAVVTNYYFNVPGRRESSIASVPALVNVFANPNAAEPVITLQPKSAIYFNGDTVNPLTVAAELEDSGVLSYQWYSNTKSSNTDGTAIEGAVAAAYTPAVSLSTPRQYFYYVKVTNTNNDAANTKTAVVASRVAEVNVASPTDKAANATFTVQFGGANQHQFVRGFGGMDVAWGNFPNYNHPSLPRANSSDDYENMYNPDILGYNMLRIMILPHNVDINKTMSDLVSNEIYTSMERSRFYENVKTVNRYGGYVLASPWSPPALWKTNNSINGGGELRLNDYKNYANYLKAFAQNMLSNGAPVYAIGIQNEPNYTAGYDGCEWSSDQMRDFYRNQGRFLEGVPGYGGGKNIDQVKTVNGESANTTTIHRSAMNNPAAKGNIDILGRHNYGSRNDNGAGTGAVVGDNWIYHATNPREMWMTEHNLNSNSGTSYPNDHTWNYIWLFMNDVDMTIRINHEAAFIWWSSKRFYSMIGDGTYGCRDGEILPRGWGLTHYSKFAKESYRVGVDYSGTTKNGAALAEGTNINGSHYADFTSETVKVSAFMKLKNKDTYTQTWGQEVNWRNKDVPIADIEEITMVMFTPTAAVGGSGGHDMGTVKLQLPAGFKIAGATAMRSDPVIFNRSGSNRGTPKWEQVPITADRNAAFVELPVSTILSVRFTQD